MFVFPWDRLESVYWHEDLRNAKLWRYSLHNKRSCFLNDVLRVFVEAISSKLYLWPPRAHLYKKEFAWVFSSDTTQNKLGTSFSQIKILVLQRTFWWDNNYSCFRMCHVAVNNNVWCLLCNYLTAVYKQIANDSKVPVM